MTTPQAHVPGDAELRGFGLLMAAMLLLSFGLLIPWLWGLAWPLWPWLAALAFAGLGVGRPRALLPVHRAWHRIGLVVGWINARLLLALVFFVIMLPIGLVMRRFSDPLSRRFDADAASYRVPSAQPKTVNLDKPF